MSINNFFNNLNNGVNEQLEIALLSEFAKSCGINNSYQLQSLESKALKKAQDNIFKSSSASSHIDSNTFKNQNADEFRNSISLLVYDIFFDLLKTEPQFFSDMQETLINFSQKNINADDLRLIVLDGVNEEINYILNTLQKAQNEGKTVTNEEIRKIVKSALINNSKKINNDVVAVSKKTTSDGLSNYTPYTKLALSQRQKGIRWRPIKGTTLSPKALERLQKQTDKIKSNLEKVKSGLKTAKSIVSLLKQLESVFSNGLIGLLKSLSKIIFSYIRDIGSSGVYMLNMCEPYMTAESFINNEKMLEKVGQSFGGEEFTVDDYHLFMLNQKISREKIIDSNAYTGRDLDRSTILINELKPDTRKKTEAGKKVDEFQDFLCGLYKPTTYAEFVQTLGEAFMDEGDMPSSALQPDAFNMKQLKGSIVRKRGLVSKYLGMNSNKIRPGRPVFGEGSNATVVIVAFSLPNFIKLASDSISAAKAFVNILDFFGMNLLSTQTEETRTWWADNADVFVKRLNRLWKKTTSKSLYDYYPNPPIIDDDGNVVSPKVDSEDPDFYGIAVKSLLPDFFEYMNIVEARIDKYVKSFKSSLSKELDNILKNIEELIYDLEDFIQIIDDVVAFFQTLKDMGLYTLQITSNGGNEDIVQKIKVAEGFPGVADGDKLRLIGGLVFCYGTPNPNPGQIDFSGIIKQKMTAMNYEASKAKYESDPNSTDDPGSFEDFANSSGLIGNLGGSLDKIFKKLF